VHHTGTTHVVIPTNPTQLDAYKKRNVKAKILILDIVKYHLILHILGKNNAYEMWESLTKIYESSN